MPIGMFVSIAVYVILVIFCARRTVGQLEIRAQERLLAVSTESQRVANQKESLYLEKMLLGNETAEIFTLYEITKEITKSLREQEAFEIFKHKLKEHVEFEECLLVHPLSQELKDYGKDAGYFLFPLEGKRGKIGYLVIRGMTEDSREKFMILGHQFALALRRVKLYQEIERIAITDGLTEVHTRRYVLERFREEIQRSQARGIQLSVLMVDVDFFKNFNDQYGHLAGDQILREVGRLMKENIREIDIAGRFGGEEFCVILPDTDQGGAHFAAERIRSAVERASIRAYDAVVKITLSVGVATYPQNGTTTEELIDKADWALYRAKKLGRNRTCAFGVYES